jgi:hypothetical protein
MGSSTPLAGFSFSGKVYRAQFAYLAGHLPAMPRSPGIRRELIDLARRYDRRGDYFDRRFR